MSIWACDSGVFMNFMKSQAAACTSGEPVLVMYQAAPAHLGLVAGGGVDAGEHRPRCRACVRPGACVRRPAMPVPVAPRNDSTEVAGRRRLHQHRGLLVGHGQVLVDLALGGRDGLHQPVVLHLGEPLPQRQQLVRCRSMVALSVWPAPAAVVVVDQARAWAPVIQNSVFHDAISCTQGLGDDAGASLIFWASVAHLGQGLRGLVGVEPGLAGSGPCCSRASTLPRLADAGHSTLLIV